MLSTEFDLYKTLQLPVFLLGLLSADLNLKFTLIFMILPIVKNIFKEYLLGTNFSLMFKKNDL